MKDLINELRTPIKVNRLVIQPSYKKDEFDSHTVDGPFPFHHDGRYYMTYVGWDGIGYRTGLASSSDLLNWEKEGLILGRGPRGSVTEFNAAMTCILRDNELYGPGTLKKVDGRFVGTYHAYPKPGNEVGPAVIGLCYSDDLWQWEVDDPILRPEDGAAWEFGGLYKSYILEHEGTYYLFYNAKNVTEGNWIEQTGVAISTDLKHWERYGNNPVLRTGDKGSFDDRFASDPCVFRHRDAWVMFYYGYCSDGHARDDCAFSNDLFNWEKSDEILVDIGPPGSVDSTYAHKPGMISKDGRLFHFYCAVSPTGTRDTGEIECDSIRGISVAHN